VSISIRVCQRRLHILQAVRQREGGLQDRVGPPPPSCDSRWMLTVLNWGMLGAVSIISDTIRMKGRRINIGVAGQISFKISF